MIITFLGHAQFPYATNYEQTMLAFLEETVGDQPVDMYLGGYGGAYSTLQYAKQKKKSIFNLADV